MGKAIWAGCLGKSCFQRSLPSYADSQPTRRQRPLERLFLSPASPQLPLPLGAFCCFIAQNVVGGAERGLCKAPSEGALGIICPGGKGNVPSQEGLHQIVVPEEPGFA